MRLPRPVPLAAGLALAGATLAAPPSAGAQVAFAPGVGTIPDGVALSAVPAVSADRRYVRLSVGAGFQTVDGFTNVAIPFGVSGLGGPAGGGGGAGGFQSVGVPMGMDGPAPSGLAAGPASAPAFPGPDAPTSADASPPFAGSWSPPRRTRSPRSRPAATRKPTPAATKPAATARPR